MTIADAQEVIRNFDVDTTQLTVDEVLEISQNLQAEVTAAFDKPTSTEEK